MADLHLKCPLCATENVFSEFSDESARYCRNCGLSLGDFAASAGTPGEPGAAPLRVRGRAARKPPPVPAAGAAGAEVPVAGRAASLLDARKEGGRNRWAALLAFLVFSALFVGPQAALDRHPWLENGYLAGRYLVAALGLLMICAEAFREGAVPGLLCLFIPFYAVFYGLTRVESYWRQGFTLAVLAMIGAELYFLPGEAMVAALSDWVNARIEGGSRLIQRAGEAPL